MPRADQTLTFLLLASVGALAAALVVQYVGGYAPCPLCVAARWPHVALILGAGFCLLAGTPRTGLVLAIGAYLTVFAISGYHHGVEQAWFRLPSDCAVVGDAGNLGSLRDALLVQSTPTCDQPAVVFLGLSMAVWHALMALGLAGVAALALTRGDARTA